MIRGITKDEVADFVVKEYDEPGDAAEFTPTKGFIPELLGDLVN